MSSIETWQSIFTRARKALKEGNKKEARRLARKVIAMAPDKEAPWLLLAATSSSQASVGYLKQALKINPGSKRAKQGLRWARKQAKNDQLGAIALNNRKESSSSSPTRSIFILSSVALIFGFALFAWLRPPGLDQGIRSVSAAAAHQVSAMLSSPTANPSNTATASPTPTKTATPTASPTTIPSETSSPTPSQVPTSTNTAIPTNGPESSAAQKKFRLEIPAAVDKNDRWIDLNLTTQLLTAYEGEEALRSFVISSGRAGTPTVVGDFAIWVKVRIQDMSGPGYYLTDVPYVMYFYEDYGIHGTYWHNNFGTPMSAGCVNMTIDDSYWMFQFASVGTIVSVHY